LQEYQTPSNAHEVPQVLHELIMLPLQSHCTHAQYSPTLQEYEVQSNVQSAAFARENKETITSGMKSNFNVFMAINI
jgi:hypothetical protein